MAYNVYVTWATKAKLIKNVGIKQQSYKNFSHASTMPLDIELVRMKNCLMTVTTIDLNT